MNTDLWIAVGAAILCAIVASSKSQKNKQKGYKHNQNLHLN